jgi:hypothetical protein
MPEVPDEITRLDDFLAAARIAHETIWELHLRLIALGRYDDEARERLLAAARTMNVDMDETLREARRLRLRWSEQELLDPMGAEETLHTLSGELDRVSSKLTSMRAQQDELAREFQRRVREAD